MAIIDAALQAAVRKYVGMTTYKLSDQIRHNLSEIKALFFTPQLAVKNHLKKQIAQLFFEVNKILLLDRVDHFVGFLECRGRDTGVILLDIPRAAALGITQASHYIKKIVDSIRG